VTGPPAVKRRFNPWVSAGWPQSTSLKLRPDAIVANDIQHTGNTSAASIPLAMAELLSTGAAKPGDLALLIGYGAGLSYAAQVVKMPLRSDERNAPIP
jgi:3-hydroxy-3-methylglutaryl CoA synthase